MTVQSPLVLELKDVAPQPVLVTVEVEPESGEEEMGDMWMME